MRTTPVRPPACRTETLASGSAATIQWCRSCGTVSVHIGATTIRLDPAACESLWATLGEGLVDLQRRMTGDTAERSAVPKPTGLPS